MSIYEVMFVVSPDLQDDSLDRTTEKFKDLITKEGGTLLSVKDYGIKSLAYKIDKKTKGHYFLYYFLSQGSLIQELERNMRIDENIMRFMVLKSDKDAKDFEPSLESPDSDKAPESSEDEIKEVDK